MGVITLYQLKLNRSRNTRIIITAIKELKALIHHVSELTNMARVRRLMTAYEGIKEVYAIIRICDAMVSRVNGVLTNRES